MSFSDRDVRVYELLFTERHRDSLDILAPKWHNKDAGIVCCVLLLISKGNGWRLQHFLGRIKLQDDVNCVKANPWISSVIPKMLNGEKT